MHRGKTDTYPSFPEIEDQLGYNPARFLVPTNDTIDELSWATRAQAFIDGMDNVETVRAWIEVEVALEQGANGGPRKKVIRWLNHRQAVIEGRDVSVDDTEQTEARDETTESVDEPGTPTPSNEGSTETALAADGGATLDTTPICPECHGECTREEIAGKIGFWCPACGEFRAPVAMEGPA